MDVKERKAIISLSHVSMYYNSNNTINVGISDVTLDFYKGEFVAVVGESGSGKTSLINVIGASLAYHNGELYYDGFPSSHFDDEDRESFRRQRIGYVCQNYNLIDSYTVLQNVMASMIIGGSKLKYKDLKKKALEYLDKVGIANLAKCKASKISSGQKQRLGIARALAKETDIILADEPTGNLDVDNGREIIKILKDLSKDHLVIMVTHNIGEVSNEASRIIRLSDGHVISDVVIHETSSSDNEIVSNYETNNMKVAWSFSWFNRFARPKRSILLSLFIFLIAIVSFVFIGIIIINLDDTFTHDYDSSAFINDTLERIVLKKRNGEAFNDDDLDVLYNIKHVKQVDKYDLANEVNYYTIEDEDLTNNYYTLYRMEAGEVLAQRDYNEPIFKKFDKYVRSSTCIKESDLLVGAIPNKVNEIAVYGDESLLASTRKVYFQIRNLWGEIIYFSIDMKVVGVLKPDEYAPKTQIYFSEILCKEIGVNYTDRFVFAISYKNPYGSVPIRYDVGCFLFSDEIGEGNVTLAQTFFTVGTVYDPAALILSEYGAFDVNILNDNEIMEATVVKIDVSEENRYFASYESKQATIYIEDYAYMDEVLDAITKLDYDAISSYRVSSIIKNNSKIISRNITILICSVALIFVTVLTMFVLSAFLNLNKNDYMLLRLLGMNKQTMYMTNNTEIISTTILFFLLATFITVLCDKLHVIYIHDIAKYMNWYHYLVILLVDCIIAWLATRKSNNNLQKQAIKNNIGGK